MNTANQFLDQLWQYYADHGRHDLPWRQTADPYAIMVSEIMLQQTQVGRVIPKYEIFLNQLPTIEQLAEAPLGDVLRLWSGLGYNRRAKFLWQAAIQTMEQYAGNLPADVTELTKLSGIGPNTAGAIMAYAHNQPVIFLETNVRTVYIHYFFADQDKVPDAEIKARLEETLDRERPREFYWALMDYGTYLKQTAGNAGRRSATYTKQSTFAGSRRQLRGQVLRSLADGPQTAEQLTQQINDARLESVLQDLVNEQLIIKQNDRYRL